MAVARVAKRVREGGHDIPVETIHRRYWLGLENIFRILASIVDSWMFFDNEHDAIELANEDVGLNANVFTRIKELCLNRKK